MKLGIYCKGKINISVYNFKPATILDESLADEDFYSIDLPDFSTITQPRLAQFLETRLNPFQRLFFPQDIRHFIRAGGSLRSG